MVLQLWGHHETFCSAVRATLFSDKDQHQASWTLILHKQHNTKKDFPMATYESMTLENCAGSHTVPVSSRDFLAFFRPNVFSHARIILFSAHNFLTVNARWSIIFLDRPTDTFTYTYLQLEIPSRGTVSEQICIFFPFSQLNHWKVHWKRKIKFIVRKSLLPCRKWARWNCSVWKP